MQPVFCSPASFSLNPCTWDLFGCVVFKWVHSGLFIRGYIPAKFSSTLYYCWVLSQSWSPNISLPKVPLYHRLSVTWLHSIRADDGSRAQDSSLHWGRVYLIKASSIELYQWALGILIIRSQVNLFQRVTDILKLFSPKAPFSQRLFYTVWHFRSLWNAPHVRLGCKSLSMRASPR